eukprot:scaffold41973_cov31-Tisochrysis_lutea.AAC.2
MNICPEGAHGCVRLCAYSRAVAHECDERPCQSLLCSRVRKVVPPFFSMWRSIIAAAQWGGVTMQRSQPGQPP